MTLLLYAMAIPAIIVLIWVYLPGIYLMIRHYVDDKSWDSLSAKRQGKIINVDRTAFDGRFGPVVLAIVVLFLFLFLIFCIALGFGVGAGFQAAM